MPGTPKFKALCAKIDELGGEDFIFEELAMGRTQTKIGKMLGVSRQMLYKWSKRTTERRKLFKEAEKMGGDVLAEESLDDLLDLKGRDLTSAEVSLARATSEGKKWMARKMNPDKWADRKVLDVNVTVQDLHLESAREASEAFLTAEREQRALLEAGDAKVQEIDAMERLKEYVTTGQGGALVVEGDFEIEQEGQNDDDT